MTTKKTTKKPVTKAGVKKPQYKREFADLYAPFKDPSLLPPDLQAELDSKGLVGRWLDAKELYMNQGYHKRGWQIYIRDTCDTMSKHFSVQGDPEGVVRNKDRILGVKPLEAVEQHKAMLRHRAMQQSPQALKKRHVDELKSIAREGRMDIKIETDFDD